MNLLRWDRKKITEIEGVVEVETGVETEEVEEGVVLKIKGDKEENLEKNSFLKFFLEKTG